MNIFEKKIKLLKVAVSNSNGVLLFDSQNGNSNSHIIKNKIQANGTVVEIPTKTLDFLFLEIPEPSIIKIDTEGAKIDILKSSDKLLSNPKIKFICELHPFAWESFGVSCNDFTSVLKKYKRTISLLDTKKKLSDLPYYRTVIF